MALVLLVEDDPPVRAALTRALTGAGLAVRAVGDGPEAVREATAYAPDLVVLDLGRPGADSTGTVRLLRSVCDAPVVVAAVVRHERDAIRLLDAGADDCVSKPFSAAHLLARIGAVLRRGRTLPAPAVPIRIGGLRVEPDQRAAWLDGQPLTLTRREYELLAYLAARAGRVVTRRELVTEVWRQPPLKGADQTLDVHLSWLRRKLGESAAAPRFLRTVRGVGVMLVAPS